MAGAARQPGTNPNQGSMLQEVTGASFVIAETFPSDPKDKLIGQSDVIYGEPGTYVDLTERADHLVSALSAFGKRNQRLGFDVASNTRQYNAPIWARYRKEVPKVQEGAQANTERFLVEAKRDFWRATGYSAMRGSSLVPDEEIDAGGRKMWRQFSTQYGDPDKRQQRDDYKATLNRYAKTAKKIIAQVAV